MKAEHKSLIYIVIAILSWSTVASAFKIALSYFSHFEMLLIAAITALIIFTVVMTFQRKWSHLSALTKRQWKKYALVSLLNPLIYYLVLFKAYDILPAQIALPINYFWPIILFILLSIMTRTEIPRVKFIGMLTSLAGVAFITLGSFNINGNSLPVAGLLLALLSAILWASFWIINNTNKEVDNIVSLFLNFFFGSLYLLITSFFVGININSLEGLFSSMYVGAFEMAIPFIFFSLALRTTGNPALINQLCYLSPFISLFIIHLVLKENIYPTTYFGLSLIVLGIGFNEYLAKRLILSKRKHI
jgi:drug/metabolite transporter (DMT)-like permease